MSTKQLDSLREDGVTWKCSDCRDTRGDSAIRSMGTSMQLPKLSFALSSCNTGGIGASDTFVSSMQELWKSGNEKVSEFEKIDDYINKTEKLITEHCSLKAEVTNLQTKINSLEQVSRLNNIEIQGIPEKQNENLVDVLKKIISTIKLI
nr:unnamed protein product [Callosobruchus chinensis]